MARQKTYSLDPNIQGADRLTGIRSENSNTANYSIDDIADFLSNTGNADGSRLGWRYDYGGEYNPDAALQPGKMYIQFLDDAKTKDFANIRTIYFKDLSKDNHSILPMRGHLAGGILKLANTSTPEQRDYAIYRVTTAAAVAGKTDETFLTLLHIASDGTFGADELVISVFQSGIGVESEGVVLRSGELEPENNEVGLQGDFYIQYEVVSELDDVPLRLYGPKASSNGAADWGDGVSMRGLAATLAIDPVVGELPFGTPGTAINEGDSLDAILKLSLPLAKDGIDGTDGVSLQSAEFTGTTLTITSTDPDAIPTISQDLQGQQGIQGGLGPKGDPGDTGPAGTDGTDGARGTQITSGIIDPDANVGEDGDYYVNVTDRQLWGPKDGDHWNVSDSVDLFGPKGDTGDAGPAGADGADGADGTDGTDGTDGLTVLNGTEVPDDDADGVDGDFYIQTTATDILIFGPKTAGAWGAGTSLIGTASISVEEVGQTAITGLDCIKFQGSGVSSVTEDTENPGCVIVTITGGGAVAQIEAVFLPEPAYEKDSFEVSQEVTFTTNWVDVLNATVDNVTLSSADSLFTDQSIDTPTSPQGFTAQNFVIPDAGTTFTVTLTYTDGDGEEHTLTDSVTLAVEKVLPRVSIARTYSDDFEFEPENNVVELYDGGDVTYTPTDALEGWVVLDAAEYAEVGGGSFVDNVYTIGPIAETLQTTTTTEFNEPGDITNKHVVNNSIDYTRSLSFRYGSVAPEVVDTPPTFSDTEDTDYGVRDLSQFNTGNRVIQYGTDKPAEVTLTPVAGEYIYFIIDSSITLTEIRDDNNINLLKYSDVVSSDTVGRFTTHVIQSPVSISQVNTFIIN